MRLFKFGSLVLEQADGDDSLPQSPRISALELPGGGLDQDGSQMLPQSNPISRRFSAINDNPLQVDILVDNLMQEMGRGRLPLLAKMRDNSERMTFAKIASVQRGGTPNFYSGRSDVTVTWRQYYPYWLAAEDEPPHLGAGHLISDGLTIGGNLNIESVTTVPHTYTVANNGTARFSRGVLYIEPQSGASITDPRFINRTANMHFQYRGTLGQNDTLTISFLPLHVMLNSTPAFASIIIPPGQTDLMWLELGDNDIEIEAAAITGTVNFTWQFSKHYL